MNNPVSVFDAAKVICERSNWTVTNLSLQKILYLSHMFFMGRTGGEKLIRENFEAWEFGPVVPALYHKVKMFGSGAIRDGFFSAIPIQDGPRAAILDEASNALLPIKASKLVAITHAPHGAWAQSYNRDIKGIVIPSHRILEEYRYHERPAGPAAAPAA